MKQLGNLAIVCAKRADVSLQISEGQIFVRCDTISPQHGLHRGMTITLFLP